MLVWVSNFQYVFWIFFIARNGFYLGLVLCVLPLVIVSLAFSGLQGCSQVHGKTLSWNDLLYAHSDKTTYLLTHSMLKP